jgi:hypothetical protein
MSKKNKYIDVCVHNSPCTCAKATIPHAEKKREIASKLNHIL